MELINNRYTLARGSLPTRLLLNALSDLSNGSLDVEIDGRVEHFEGNNTGPAGHIQIDHPARLLQRIVTGGSIGFAEGFMRGDWHSEDLMALLWVLAINPQGKGEHAMRLPVAQTLNQLRHLLRRNSKRGSRRNIAYHYDLGNDFYNYWLDPSMTYSSALFEHADDTLLEAQHRKYERMLELSGESAGQKILEIGCGWGGFAEFACAQDLNLTGLTLSREQQLWATKRLAQANLAHLGDIRYQDYRDVQGQYDRIVSIEMFEAVGEQYWPTYMEKVARLLKPGGRAALQVITIAEDAFASYRREPDFIQRYVFPGGMLPSVSAFDQAAADTGLKIRQREMDGAGYARTLHIWHEQFVRQREKLTALGLDERFQRMWRYYLAYCEVGFRIKRIDLMRVALSH